MLQISNYKLQNIKENHIKIKDQEEIIPGIISTKEFEYKGLIINTPEIIRRLKRLLKNTFT
jgi:hypothetical protein